MTAVVLIAILDSIAAIVAAVTLSIGRGRGWRIGRR
jgi:hypothetical protein